MNESEEMVRYVGEVLERGDFDEISGTYAFFSLNHDGQNSFSYGALSILSEEFSPGMSWSESNLNAAEADAFDAAAVAFGAEPYERMGPQERGLAGVKGSFTNCECGRRAIARGMCGACYAQWRRSGDTTRRRCTVEGCRDAGSIRGLCPKHYARQLQHGTTDDPPPRPPSDRLTITLPDYVLDSMREVIGRNESMSAFAKTAVVNEIERRRILR